MNEESRFIHCNKRMLLKIETTALQAVGKNQKKIIENQQFFTT